MAHRIANNATAREMTAKIPAPVRKAVAARLNSHAATVLLSDFTKTAIPAPGSSVAAGDTITYIVRVRNNDTRIDGGPRITDQLPPNTTFVSYAINTQAAAPFTCDVTTNPGYLTCYVAPYAQNTALFGINDTFEVQYTVRVNPTAPVGTLTAPAANYGTNYGSTAGAFPGGAENNNSVTVQHNVIYKHDLSIAKLATPEAVAVGGLINYKLIVTNNGPSVVPAGAAIVNDNILSQPGVTLQGFIQSNTFTGSCNGGTNFGACSNLDPILPGEFGTINYQVRVNNDFAPVPGTIKNKAELNNLAGDPILTNNVMQRIVAVSSALSDVAIKKHSSPAMVTAGDASSVITYSINFYNNGPAAATDVQITDVVSANLDTAGFIINAPDWDCNGFAITAGNHFTCKFTSNGGVLAPGTGSSDLGGAMQPIYLQARVPANVAPGTLIANQAKIVAAQPDPNSANNLSLPTSTLVKTKADLSVVKTDTASGNGPDPVVAGQTTTYRIRVNNNPGPSDARDVVWTDLMDAGTTFVSLTGAGGGALPGGWSCTAPTQGTSGVVSCSRALLPVNSGDQDFFLTVRVLPGFAGNTVSNVTTLLSSTPDDNLGNNTEGEDTTVTRQVNLTIAKAGTPNPVVAGANLTYTISVGNSGPSSAVGVTVTDALPANTTFVSAVGTGVFGNGGGGCVFTPGAPVGTVTCTPAGGDLPPGGAETITIVVKTNPAFAGVIGPNKATVIATNPGTSTMSNEVNVTAILQTDISIKKEDSPDAVTAGQQIAYTLTLKNNGPSDAPANSVTVNDATPANTTYVAGSLDTSGALGFTCTTNPLNCVNSGATMPAGATAIIKFKVQVNANAPTGFITNMATVSSPNDPNSTNNSGMTQTAVGPNADLQLTKVATTAVGFAPGAFVVAGGTSAGPIASALGAIEYTLTYKNNGPSTATNVVITDVLPANTLYVAGTASVTANQGATPSCSIVPGPGAGNQAKCTVAALNPGDNGVFTFRVRVPADVPNTTVIKNQAVITSDTPDSNTSSNTTIETMNVVKTAADLSIQKTAPATVVAGNTVSYILAVANTATALTGSDAKDVVVKDILPLGTTFISVSSSSNEFVCTAPSVGTNGTVTCARANMPVGANATITIVAQVDPTQTASPIVNQASIQTSTTDANQANNTSSASTTVTRTVGLSIVKTAAPNPVVAGTNLTYTITVGNAGPSAALGATVTDPLPANTSFVSAVGTGIFSGSNGGGCAFASGTVTCTPANGVFPPNSSETITIVALVAPNAPATVGPNVATVASSNPSSSVSSTPVTVNVVRSVDMTIKKDDSPDAVQAGQNISYTVTVTNNGPSEAPQGSVTMSDPVPANTTIVGSPDVSLAPGFTCNATVSCNNANAAMAPGAKAIIRFTVQVNAGFGTGAINNVATVSATQNQANIDPNTNNNTASETTSVGPFADLQLTKTASAGPVIAGGPAPGSGQITYSIAYRNNGPSDAIGVQITDTVAANLALIPGVNITAVGLSCNGLPPTPGAQFVCTPVAGGFNGNAAGVLPVGSQGTISFSLRVPASVAQGSLVSNAALIASVGSIGTPATPDPNTANNSQNATSTLVNAVADLSIVKTQSASTVTAGGASINYTLQVANNGVSDAQNVVVNDSLPAGLEFLAVSQTLGSGFTCTNPTIGQNGVVSCTKGVMAAGEMATFVITVRAPATAAAATRTNTATVQSSTTDSGPGANSSSIATQIVTDANVTITKLDNPDPVVAGENLTYTVTVTNSGPSIARSVTVTDPVPANTTFVSMAGTGILGNCTLTSGTISCTPENLGVGESATLTVVVKVNADAPSSVQNVATVTWTDSDSTPGTQQATAPTAVIKRTDLTIKKSDSPHAVLSGNNIVYTIKVRNNGPSQAAVGGVIVKDATPVNTTDVSLSGTGPFAGCTLALLHGAGCANASVMNPGDEATLTYTVQVIPGTPTGFITNTATVEASPASIDPNTTNNSSTTQTAVGPYADLQLTKTSTPASVVAGGPAPGSGQITYSMTYRNDGPSDAIGVSITDTVAANLAAIPGATITATGLSCNGFSPVPGAQFSCSPLAGAFGANAAGVLPIGASGTITYSVRVPAGVSQGTLIANAALITSYGNGSTPATPDPNTANNSQNATSTLVNAIADLSIVKTQSASTVTAGGASIAYTLVVTNNGVSDAQNVVVNDSLPAGLEFLSVAQTVGSGFTCTNPTIGQNGVVTCAKGVMAAGETATFVIGVRAPATASAAVRTNTATVQSSTTDNGPGANSSSVQTTIVTDANVTITKLDTPDPVVAGENLTYTVTVTNSGPSIARSVTVTDPIPANTTFVSMAGTGILGNCTLNSGTISCTPENLGVGESATLTVVVKVNADAPSSVQNVATVTWTDSDSTPGTQQATAPTAVIKRTDLTIKKSDSPQAVLAGNNIIYTIKVRNNGPSQAAVGGVIVKDATPVNTTDVSLSGTGPFAGCTLALLHGAGCANAGVMNPGDEATLTYTVKVIPGTPTGFIANTATVEASPAGNDPNTTNNSSTTQTAVGPHADLQLTKTSTPASVLAGGPAPGSGQITYSMTYRNDGPSDAVGVSITDTVAANLAAIPGATITAAGLSCNGTAPAPGGQFSCSPLAGAFGANAAGVLPVGASGTITYSLRVPAGVPQGTLIANAALITSYGNGSTPATPDPNTANNSQNATSTLVNTSADLTITKTDSPDPVIAGSNLTYTITVANAAGPSDAQNVVISDTLPAQTTFVSIASSDASVSCTAPPVGASGLVTCNKATLPVGASVTLTLTVKVKANTPSGAVISNAATVGSQTSDPTPGSNTSTTTTTVNTEATLSVIKTDSPDPVVAGTNLTYSITVTNSGPSDAQNVTLSDPLPAQTSYVSLSGTGIFGTAGACTHNGGTPGTVSCGGGLVLPAGQSATLNIVVKVASSAQVAPPGTPITNTVSVSSPTDAGSPRTASATTNVKREADMELTKTAPATVIAGNNIDYTLKVKNNGPSDVDGGSQPGTITVVDTLPAGVTPLTPLSSPNVTISGPGGFTCSFASGKLTCVNAAGDPGDFPAGSVVTIIFKARVSSSLAANTNINNCAVVNLTGLEVDPVGGNNSSCASTVIQTSADLGAGKTAPQQGVAGQNIAFNITFGNAGPSDAVNVRITDNIPANTTYQTPVSPFTVLAVGGVYTGGNSVKLECTVTGGNTLTCTPKGNTGLTPSLADGVLPAGVTGAFSYDVKINASVTGGTILANGVNITSAPSGSAPGTPDPNTGNNTSLNTSTVVIAQSQLVVTKAVQTATFAQSPPAPAGAVVPGTNLTYRISVTNNGPSDVNNVQVADTLPSNVTYLSAVPAIGSGFTCLPANGGVVTCNAPLLPNGVTRTIDVTVFIDPATKVELVNKADASGISNGFNQVLNAPTFTLNTPVGPTSDLVLTKTHLPEPVIAGNNVVYTLTLRNNGPSTAAMVNLVDTLPTSQSLAAPADVSGAPGFSCTPNTIGATGVITCSAASMAPNTQVVIRLTAKVDPSTPAGVYNNVATAASMSFDPTPASVVDPVTVITRADLSITKSAPATVVAGTQMTYTINATNNGPSSAANMKITDILPTGTVFISASAPGSSSLITPAVNANGTVTATWAGLTLPGVTRTLTIVVRVCSEVACDTNINNTATTSSDTQDDNPANNSATATTKVQVQWDLSIAKAGPTTIAPDGSFAYTLTVANAGPSVATNVIVTDLMPKGFFVVGTPTATISGAVVTVTTNSTTGQQTVTADLKSVGADNQCSTNLPKTVTITINVKVAKTMPFITVTNTASVASNANCTGGNQGDQNAANNTATLSTKVVNGGPEVGREYPADSDVSDQKAGSVLVFPIYTSDAASPNRENTRISITNTHQMERACIHLFGVDGASCSVADAFVCLTPNQTTTFLASDLDPGNRGYFVAVAVDCETGLPKAFNFLIGDSFVKFSTGHQANLAAESIAATMWFPAGANPNQRTATLNFDGMSYNRLPAILSLDNIQSPVDGNNTMLIVDRIGGDLTNAGANIGPLFGFLYNDQEVGYSFTANVGACQLRQTLSNSFPRTLTPFSSVIPAGRTGWMKFWSNNEYGIFGAMINLNPNAAANSGSFNQGHNLHKHTLAPSSSLTIPVVVPFC